MGALKRDRKILLSFRPYPRMLSFFPAWTHASPALLPVGRGTGDGCPNDCSGHGVCFLDRCICEKPYVSADCSLRAPSPFLLLLPLLPRSKHMCRRRTLDCNLNRHTSSPIAVTAATTHNFQVAARVTAATTAFALTACASGEQWQGNPVACADLTSPDDTPPNTL